MALNRVTVSRGAGELQKSGRVTEAQWNLVKVAATLAGVSSTEYSILAAVEKAEAQLGSVRDAVQKAQGGPQTKRGGGG